MSFEIGGYSEYPERNGFEPSWPADDWRSQRPEFSEGPETEDDRELTPEEIKEGRRICREFLEPSHEPAETSESSTPLPGSSFSFEENLEGEEVNEPQSSTGNGYKGLSPEQVAAFKEQIGNTRTNSSGR